MEPVVETMETLDIEINIEEIGKLSMADASCLSDILAERIKFHHEAFEKHKHKEDEDTFQALISVSERVWEHLDELTSKCFRIKLKGEFPF